ncbi:DUF4962 domain-containing protein [Rugamonas apoptosis]|uniref:DUF4962 domain-containing protein n=1 Tax=Rugamonas apoptosis TaxID=2758570 RepID=A0A7W2IMS7_9BURK|nr:DUF4962 domain-containing protein [Rugamonas apoptosis]MBA5690090.1 DUF4962 domain-containing protein [Rugamonas apoptosis]
MSFNKLSLIRGALLVTSALAWNACYADWAQSSYPLNARPLPANSEQQAQNPPAFSWSRHSTLPATYVLEITGPLAGQVTTVTVDKNWYLPTKAMALGSYSWRVRPGGTSTDWSTPRTFILNSSSAVFEVPDSSVLRTNIINRARPRAMPNGMPIRSSWSAGMVAERGNALTRLQNAVLATVTSEPPVSDSLWPLVTSSTLVTADTNAQWTNIRTHVNIVRRQLESAALIYRLTGDRTYLTEAITRGDQLASLSPSGPTSYAQFDTMTLPIAASLAKGVDFLYADLDATRRAAWLNNAAARATDVYNDLSRQNGWLDQMPFDEHGGSNLGYLALVATLSLGDVPAAATWFDFSFRNYINYVFHWSGAEGGYANGTAYGQYAIDASLQVWQPMSTASGLNMFNKPWTMGFLKMFMYFTPPGSQVHAFGDSNESKPDLRFMKALASRIPTPQALWYYKNITGDEDPLTQLQIQYPLPVLTVATAVAPSNSIYIPSIGWAAFHSNIADPLRTSLYFKASPYGSFNHSHGDQNAFTLSKGARRLLIGTGWYDWYNSPMWSGWYRQTKSKNALTYDGGLGQNTTGYSDPMLFNGQIVGYSTTNSNYDYVEGDATAAFAGALTSNRRQLWYFRAQDAFVVRDKVTAPAAHVFEWNLHAPVPITVNAATGEAQVVNVDQSVCVRPIPNNSGQTYAAVTGPAPQPGTTEYHGVYKKTSSQLSAEFLMLLDVGCKHPTVTVVNTASGRSLTVGGVTISLPQ